MDVSPSPSPRGAARRAIKPRHHKKSPNSTIDTAKDRKFSKVNYIFDMNKLGINSSGGRDQFAKVNTSDVGMRTPRERSISPVSSTDPGPEDFTINMMKYFEGVQVGDHIIPPWDESKDKRGRVGSNGKTSSDVSIKEQPKLEKESSTTETKAQSPLNNLVSPETEEVASPNHPSEGTIPSPPQAKVSASYSTQSSRGTSTQPSLHRHNSLSYINDESFMPHDVDSVTYQYHPNYRHPSVEDYVSDAASVHSDKETSPCPPQAPTQAPQDDSHAGSSLRSASSVEHGRRRATETPSPMPWDQPLPEMHPTAQQVLDQIYGLQEQVRIFQEEAEEERERSHALEEENNALTIERDQLDDELVALKTTYTNETAQLQLDLQTEKAANATEQIQLKQALQTEKATNLAEKARLENDLQSAKTLNASEKLKLEQDLQAEKVAGAANKAKLEQDLDATKATYATEKAKLMRELEEMKSMHEEEKIRSEKEIEALRSLYASEKAQLSQEMESIRARNSNVATEPENTNAIVVDLTTQLEECRQQVEGLKNELGNVEADRNRLYNQVAGVREELTMSETNVQKLSAEINALKYEAPTEVQLNLQRELDTAKTELTTAASKQKIAQQAIRAFSAEKKDLESQLEEANGEITNIRYTLSKTRSALDRTKKTLQVKETSCTRELRELEKRLKAAWKAREAKLASERELMANALFREWGKQEVGDDAVEVEYPDGVKKRGKGYRYKY